MGMGYTRRSRKPIPRDRRPAWEKSFAAAHGWVNSTIRARRIAASSNRIPALTPAIFAWRGRSEKTKLWKRKWPNLFIIY